jgi:hypothetical protein
MEPADIARMALIVTLGFLAFITFLIAGTIVGLMWLESSNCNCIHFPVGLYVLALLGILLLASMISESLDAPPVFEGWLNNQREALIVALIFLFAVILLIF